MKNRYNLTVPEAQPLKPRERARIHRNALPPVDRAVQWPIDNDEMWARRWRNLAWFDVAFCAVAVVVVVVVVALIISLPSAGQVWSY